MAARWIDVAGPARTAGDLDTPFRPTGEATSTGETAAVDDTWRDSAEQVAFRDGVLAAHVARSRGRKGAPLADLGPGGLRRVAGTRVEMATTAADMAGRLLAAAHQALATAQQAGDPDAAATERITVVSGYRGSDHQRRLWCRYFTRYYNETRSDRGRLPGGPHSPAAVQHMLEVYRIPNRIAAPGYSNHQAGIAADFLQVRKGRERITNSTRPAAVQRWRATWFFRWLERNAATYGFVPYPKEPWHWAHRPGGGQRETPEPLPTAEAEDPELDALAEDEYWGAEESEESDDPELGAAELELEDVESPVDERPEPSDVETSDPQDLHAWGAAGHEAFEQLAPLVEEAEGVFDDVMARYRSIIAATKRVLANPAPVGSQPYDRRGALEYARTFWRRPCDDQFIAIRSGSGRNFVQVPPGTTFEHEPRPDGSSAGQEHARLPDGTQIPWSALDDCTHFISCCIGQRPGRPCGGLAIGYHQLGAPPRAPYGIVRVSTMVDFLAGRLPGHPRRVDVIAERSRDLGLVTRLEPGDLVAYFNTTSGRYSHLAMLLDGERIACHTYCRSDHPDCTWDNHWALGCTTHSWTFLHFTDRDR